MSDWHVCNLGAVVTFQRGFDITLAEQSAGHFPVVSSSGITSYHNMWKVNGPGVVIGRKGTLGTVHYLRGDFWPHDTTLWVKDFQGNFPLFVFYYLKSLDLGIHDVGSSNPTLNRNHLHLLPACIPRLNEQMKIAGVLNSLDNKIYLLHRQSKTLEAMAETLFRQWFVEEADSTWEKCTVGDLLTIKGGTTPSTSEPAYWDGDIAWTSPRDLSNTRSVYLFDTRKKITPLGLTQIGSGLLPVGTVLLSSRAPIGYLAIADLPVAINQGYIAMVCDDGIPNYYAYLWCKQYMNDIKSAGNGSTFEEISKSNFKALPFIVPPVEKLEAFDSIAKPMFAKLRANTLQIRKLENMRDALLPKLMSGEVRVAC